MLLQQLQPSCNELEEFVLSSTTVAANIDEFGNALERSLHIEWLDHMAHNINGVSESLAFFYRHMAYPVYAEQKEYSKALWAMKKEIAILDRLRANTDTLASALIAAKTSASRMGNKEEYCYFDSRLKSMNLSDYQLIDILKNDFLQYIENADKSASIDIAKRTIEIAEIMDDDKILSLAYEQMVMIAGYFTTDIDKEMYASLALKHYEKYVSEHMPDIEKNSQEAADVFKFS